MTTSPLSSPGFPPIDFDFETVAAATGCLERSDRLGATFPILEDQPHFQVLTAQQRQKLIPLHVPMAPLVQKIKNQKQEGSCASNAALAVFELVMAFMGGVENWVEMSAMSLYKRVGQNAQSGSTINDNLRELVANGALPVDSPENRARFQHTHPATGFGVPLPPGWIKTGNLFLMVEWFDVATWDGLLSALLYKMPVLYGRAGHAICGVDPVLKDGAEFIKYQNSWSAQWGDRGFGLDSRRAVESSIPSYGAWAGRVVAFVASRPLPVFATSA